MNEATYIVIDVDLITNDMVNESICSESTYRKSLDGTKAILKFNVKHPNSMVGVVKYTHEEILIFLSENSVDWNGEV